MRQTRPQVFILAATEAYEYNIEEMLKAAGCNDQVAQQYAFKHDTSDGEKLVEIAGRLCYKSFEPGLNPNVQKIREGNELYIRNILQSKHGSVLEHATVTFAFINVSRVFTHEIVRHRAGTAFSQESMRYVRLDDIPYRYPEIFKSSDFIRAVWEAIPQEERYREKMTLEHFTESWHDMMSVAFSDVFNASEQAVKAVTETLSLNDMKSFHVKKAITSAMRRFIPDGVTTNIIVTANHRAWRHIIEQRAGEGSKTMMLVEEEIQEVVGRFVAPLLKAYCPNIYQDMERNPDCSDEWLFASSKI